MIHIDSTPEIVEDIRSDLKHVEWVDITPTVTAHFKVAGVRALSMTGNRWTHNVIIYVENGVESCTGAAVHLRIPLIIRYTPELAVEVLKLIKEGDQP